MKSERTSAMSVHTHAWPTVRFIIWIMCTACCAKWRWRNRNARKYFGDDAQTQIRCRQEEITFCLHNDKCQPVSSLRAVSLAFDVGNLATGCCWRCVGFGHICIHIFFSSDESTKTNNRISFEMVFSTFFPFFWLFSTFHSAAGRSLIRMLAHNANGHARL